MTVSPAMSLKGVSKTYGTNQVLSDITLDIEPGTLTIVTGHNGSGKSTMLNIMSGLTSPDMGEVTVFGATVGSAQASSAIARLLEYPIVASALRARDIPTIMQLDQAEHHRFRLILEAMGTPLDARIGRMSRGTLTRSMVAGAFSQNAKIVLLDEPTVGLDLHAETILHDLIGRAVGAGVAVVVATHHLGLISPKEIDKFVALERGRIEWSGRIDLAPSGDLSGFAFNSFATTGNDDED